MYKIENPYEKAMGGMNQASGAYGSMMKDVPANRQPGKTAGGALMSGVGGAAMVAQAGSLMGATAGTVAVGGAEAVAGVTALGMGPIGWAGLGLAAGIGAYLFS